MYKYRNTKRNNMETHNGIKNAIKSYMGYTYYMVI